MRAKAAGKEFRCCGRLYSGGGCGKDYCRKEKEQKRCWKRKVETGGKRGQSAGDQAMKSAEALLARTTQTVMTPDTTMPFQIPSSIDVIVLIGILFFLKEAKKLHDFPDGIICGNHFLLYRQLSGKN